jgi:RNase adaptor protein for sRNA GlmZ degradation
MVQVVDYEEFSALKRVFEVIKEDNQFLRSLLLGERWLTRKQVVVAMGCKDDKLRQLTLNNTFTYRCEGLCCMAL